MAKRYKHVRVRVLRSFGQLRRGDESPAILDERMQGWIDAGLIKVVEQVVADAKALTPLVEPGWVANLRKDPDGTGAAGPGGAEQDTDERVADGAAGGVPAGGESGQGFGAGGYGTPPGIDQG